MAQNATGAVCDILQSAFTLFLSNMKQQSYKVFSLVPLKKKKG